MSILTEKLKNYLEEDERLALLFTQTKQKYDEKALPAHNWEHTYRDVINAIEIGEAEGADMNIVLPAMVMHDIGFLYGGTGPTHCEIGAEKLDEYLKDLNIEFPKDQLEHIRACIQTHKGSRFGQKPQTLEARVVTDADLLEKFGPLGIYQFITAWIEFGRDIHKLIGVRDDLAQNSAMETKTGTRLVGDKKEYILNYLDLLKEEYIKYQ